jgi:PAS domain S-box-containing protein/putative nucleotidyltransferase with HDIG domain
VRQSQRNNQCSIQKQRSRLVKGKRVEIRPINVLLIEGNPGDARLIQEMLAEGGDARFKLECVDRLSTGLACLVANDIGLVLLDLGLPDSQGFDTFAQAHAQAPRMPIVVLSGVADENLAIKTVQKGAQDYLVKGDLDSYSLLRTMRYAIERKRAEEELRGQALIFENIQDSIVVTDLEGNILKWNPAAERMFGYYKDEVFHKTLSMLTTRFIKGTLHDGRWTGEMNFTRKDGTKGVCETTVIPLCDEHGNVSTVFGVSHDITAYKRSEEELQRSYDKLRDTMIATVNTLASTVEMRDPYTAGHQRRVTILACAMAEEMGLTEEQFDGLRLAGLIHDIGKISVPVEILNKPGRLSGTEFDIIKGHPQAGYNILQEIELPWPVAQIILQHHERLDGSGYPQGLKNGGIMFEAKILAVADVVEAMASHRPYRPALGVEAALEEIAKNQGILYDPEMVDICQSLFTEKGFTFE